MAKILQLRNQCHLGPQRIAWYLERYHGFKTSCPSVTRTLKRNGIGPLPRNVGRRAPHTHRYAKQLPGHQIQIDVMFLELVSEAGPKLSEDRRPATAPNECWSMDFVHDEFFDGAKVRLLTIVGSFSRVSPAIGVRNRFQAGDVVDILNAATQEYGVPKCIRVDNGPEFVSKELDIWAYANGVRLDFSSPGKPTDDAYIESFNSRL